MLSLLYRYITHPYTTITRGFAPVGAAVVVVGLSAVVAAARMPMGMPLMSILFYLVAALAVWVIQTAFVEFCAQLMGYSAPRLVVFSWLGMAQLPMALLVPLMMLGGGMAAWGGVLQLVCLGFQLMTLKKIYGISWISALFIFTMPWLGLIAAGLFLTISYGVLLW